MIDRDARMKLMGKRIKDCRNEAGLSQKELLKKIYMSESSTPSLRAYESGELMPDMETLARMCDIFHCDFGYLIGDYSAKRREVEDVCKQTGLSERSVATLRQWKTVDMADDMRKAVDLLLTDAIKQNGRFRPILRLISLFMNFDKLNQRAYIDSRGNIKIGDRAGGGEIADGELYVPADSIVFDKVMVENALLLEIQSALISLKEEAENSGNR